MNNFKTRTNAGERPEFITAADVRRWDDKLGLLRQIGTPTQLGLIASLDQDENGVEHFYTGEWLGEELKAAGCDQRERSAICFLHGRTVAAGKGSSWQMAVEIAAMFDFSKEGL